MKGATPLSLMRGDHLGEKIMMFKALVCYLSSAHPPPLP